MRFYDIMSIFWQSPQVTVVVIITLLLSPYLVNSQPDFQMEEKMTSTNRLMFL